MMKRKECIVVLLLCLFAVDLFAQKIYKDSTVLEWVRPNSKSYSTSKLCYLEFKNGNYYFGYINTFRPDKRNFESYKEFKEIFNKINKIKEEIKYETKTMQEKQEKENYKTQLEDLACNFLYDEDGIEKLDSFDCPLLCGRMYRPNGGFELVLGGRTFKQWQSISEIKYISGKKWEPMFEDSQRTIFFTPQGKGSVIEDFQVSSFSSQRSGYSMRNKNTKQHISHLIGGYGYEVKTKVTKNFIWKIEGNKLHLKYTSITNTPLEVIPNLSCPNCEPSYARLWVQQVRNDVATNPDIAETKKDLKKQIEDMKKELVGAEKVYDCSVTEHALIIQSESRKISIYTVAKDEAVEYIFRTIESWNFSGTNDMYKYFAKKKWEELVSLYSKMDTKIGNFSPEWSQMNTMRGNVERVLHQLGWSKGGDWRDWNNFYHEMKSTHEAAWKYSADKISRILNFMKEVVNIIDTVIPDIKRKTREIKSYSYSYGTFLERKLEKTSNPYMNKAYNTVEYHFFSDSTEFAQYVNELAILEDLCKKRLTLKEIDQKISVKKEEIKKLCEEKELSSIKESVKKIRGKCKIKTVKDCEDALNQRERELEKMNYFLSYTNYIKEIVKGRSDIIDACGKQFSDISKAYDSLYKSYDFSANFATKEEYNAKEEYVKNILLIQDRCKQFIKEREKINITHQELLVKGKGYKNILKVYTTYFKGADLSWNKDESTQKLQDVQDVQSKFNAAFAATNASEHDKQVKKLKDKSLENVLNILSAEK